MLERKDRRDITGAWNPKLRKLELWLLGEQVFIRLPYGIKAGFLSPNNAEDVANKAIQNMMNSAKEVE